MKPMYATLLRGTSRTPIGLYHLYKATPDQLCRLHYSAGCIKAVKARLKTLVTQGYVQYSSVAVKHRTREREYFSARYFYTLAPPGVKYLAGLGYDVEETWRPHNEPDKHGLFAEHTLELNDVIIAAALLRRHDPRLYLHSFIHERALKQRPYPVTLPDGRASKVIPDAFLDFRQVGSTDGFAVLLEHDRGTEERAHFKRKIESYVAFVKARQFETAFASKRINIVFTAFEAEERIQEIRQWTRQVLEGEPAQVHAAFRFASLPYPLLDGTAWLEPIWRYPIEGEPQALLAA
jgi:hypothetical protein